MKDDIIQITVLYGSYRSNRAGIRAAEFAVEQLSEKCKVVFLDAKEIDLPILDKMHKEYEKGKAPEKLERISKVLAASDGFIFVCGEYNHSVQPGLKNLIDHFQPEYFFKPAGILSYSAGSFGGVRAAVHMRAVLGELGMVSISGMLPIPGIGKVFAEGGEIKDEKLPGRFTKFSDELLWYAKALKPARNEGTPY